VGHDDNDADSPAEGAEARGRHDAGTAAAANDAREAASDVSDRNSPVRGEYGAPGAQELAEAERAEVEAVPLPGSYSAHPNGF
jgi:hypothetical protein